MTDLMRSLCRVASMVVLLSLFCSGCYAADGNVAISEDGVQTTTVYIQTNVSGCAALSYGSLYFTALFLFNCALGLFTRRMRWPLFSLGLALTGFALVAYMVAHQFITRMDLLAAQPSASVSDLFSGLELLAPALSYALASLVVNYFFAGVMLLRRARRNARYEINQSPASTEE